MSNTPRTPTPGSPTAKPLHVALNTIGRGLVYLLPECTEPDARAQDLKRVVVESIATPWLTPFLDEYGMRGRQPSGFVTVTQEGGIIRSLARVKMEPELECIRCVNRFRMPLETESSAIFVDEARFNAPHSHSSQRSSRQDDDDGVELEAADLETYPYRGLSFNLDEFLLDTMQSAIPDFPLCEEDCPGLCPNCGEKNVADHACAKA